MKSHNGALAAYSQSARYSGSKARLNYETTGARREEIMKLVVHTFRTLLVLRREHGSRCR
jgi:hypothetical protein